MSCYCHLFRNKTIANHEFTCKERVMLLEFRHSSWTEMAPLGSVLKILRCVGKSIYMNDWNYKATAAKFFNGCTLGGEGNKLDIHVKYNIYIFFLNHKSRRILIRNEYFKMKITTFLPCFLRKKNSPT